MAQQEKRFGAIAVQKGFITKDQIHKALEIQSNDDPEQNQHRLIGRILMDEGLIDDVQVYQILGTLHKTGGRSNM